MINLKGREVSLIYTTQEMLTIQEAIGPIDKAIKLILGRNPEDEKDRSLYAGAGHLKALSAAVRILGNAGLEEAGEAPDLTDKKILRALKPTDIATAANLVMEAMREGMESEIPKEEQKGPVDVTLEEMNKKKEKES